MVIRHLQIGQKRGARLRTKKTIAAKEGIRKYSKAFGGTLNDMECMKLLGITHNTYYKYKQELREKADEQED